MKVFMLRLLCVVIALLASSSTPLAGDGWISDYEQALAKAKESKRDLLLLFTQSDSPACRKLEAEIYAQEQFISAAEKDYVLVRLDLPEKKAAAKRQSARNKELRELYAVERLPATVQTTTEGHAYWVSSNAMKYEGPIECAELVAQWRSMGRPVLDRMLELVATYEKADESTRWPAWDKLAHELEAAAWPWQERVLVPAVRSAIDVDTDNKLGRQRRALEVLIKTRNADDATKAMAERLDPKNELGLLELMLADEYAQELEALKAQRPSTSEAGFLEFASSAVVQQEASLKKLEAFAKTFGFRSEAHEFQCYWNLAFMSHSSAGVISMVLEGRLSGEGPSEKARRELEQSAKQLIGIAKSAASKAKKLGKHPEPVAILDKVLKS